ncbi:MAG: hypothetical protein B6I38_02970 [Anaerolineaceae bacterium 4572_5.1]|nr:MAG: hypothetical protein B6I38_02970 [Anaerolineaceae bacterium 4572_5.1]
MFTCDCGLREGLRFNQQLFIALPLNSLGRQDYPATIQFRSLGIVGSTFSNHNQESTINIFAKLSPHAHWFPRLAIAASIAYHGIEKLDVTHYLESSAACQGCLVSANSTPELVILLVGVIEVGVAIALIVGGFGKAMVNRVTLCSHCYPDEYGRSHAFAERI